MTTARESAALRASEPTAPFDASTHRQEPAPKASTSEKIGDVLCLSHLRWGFVFQRPNHLMARFAARQRVFFVEEPIYEERADAVMKTQASPEGVIVCVPHLPAGTQSRADEQLSTLLRDLVRAEGMNLDVLWFYTPMALEWARGQTARTIVYDCMDELSAFRGAHPRLLELERELFERADLVFTGGHSLFEAKKQRHRAVHAFPSSVDAAHFAHARQLKRDPADQASIPHPRLGYFGVIDERLDLALIEKVSREQPQWQFVMLGPVVKIDPASLPRAPNIHWLGMKRYEELPEYISGWDVALMPFALNEATRFISPTKTLEYLAAGRPVVSTAVADVVYPYSELDLVRIGDAGTFAAEIGAALAEPAQARFARADAYLQTTSWDKTWQLMSALVDQSTAEHQLPKGARSCSTI